jgi:hypothetical protein
MLITQYYSAKSHLLRLRGLQWRDVKDSVLRDGHNSASHNPVVAQVYKELRMSPILPSIL